MATLIGIDLTVDTQSVIDIRISEVESELDAALALNKTEATKLDTEIKEMVKDRQLILEVNANHLYGAKAQLVYNAITALFPNAAKSAITVSNVDPTKRVYQANVNVHITYGMTASFEHPFPQGAIDLQETINKKTAQLLEMQMEINNIRARIASIPKYERKIRAVIATKKLEGTVEGQALLATLRATPLLPGDKFK
jgi:hypothetical protein